MSKAFHVLIIDDSPDDRADIRQMLLKGSSRLYRFTEAANGAAGVRSLREMAGALPDCVLLDFYLPDMDATEVLAQLRGGAEMPPCPVIVVTGSDTVSGPDMLHGGAQDYIGKSWSTPQSLTRVIESAAERYTLLAGRLRTEKELRASEQKLRAIYDGTHEYIGLLTPDGTLVEANRALLIFAASKREDVVGRKFWETPWFEFTPGAPETIRRAVMRAATGEFVRLEAAIRTPANEWKTFEISLAPTRGADGKVALIVPEGRDITERKRRETCLTFSTSISKALAPLVHATDILRVTSQWIAEHLGLQHCLMVEINETTDEATVLHDHHAPDVESLVGVYRLADFNVNLKEMTGGGPKIFPTVVNDTESKVAGDHFVGHGIRSLVNANYGCDGEWRFILSAQRDEVSIWPAEEIDMLVELAERIFIRLERARNDDRLQQSEENERARRAELEALMDAIPAAVFIAHDTSCQTMTGNRATAEILRLPVGANPFQSAIVEGRREFEIYRDGRLLSAEELPIQRAAATGQPISSQELDIVFANGDAVNLFGSAVPLFDGAGMVRGCVGAFMDITARRAAERALVESRERLLRAQQAAHVGLWEWDLVSGTGSWTDEAWSIYGRQPGAFAVSQENWLTCLHPDDRKRAAAVMEKARILGQYRDVFRVVDPDGAVRWVESRGQFIFDDAAQPIRVLGTVLDNTEHKRTEIALSEVARRKDEFLAMLGHELRSPLSAIRHAVQISSETPEDQDACRWATEVIGRQSLQLTRMVDDLLDVARIDYGRIELRLETLDVRAVLHRAIAVVHPAMVQRRHQFTAEMAEQLPVTGDAARLEQVFVNVLNNAAKYTPEGGRIRMDARVEEREIVISIIDNGVGISAELLPHIFDLFRQADSTLDRAQGGLGIGLTVVKSLVEMHLGRVTVESAGAHAGTTLKVRLPLLLESHSAEHLSPSRREPVSLPRPIRVLVVDDHVDAAQALARLLTRRGCEVRLAYDGPSGVIAAREYRPEVLLLDLGLPGFDGYELARILRADALLANALFIAISGYAQDGDRELSLAAGFDEHCSKPIDLDALLTSIKAGCSAVAMVPAPPLDMVVPLPAQCAVPVCSP